MAINQLKYSRILERELAKGKSLEAAHRLAAEQSEVSDEGSSYEPGLWEGLKKTLNPNKRYIGTKQQLRKKKQWNG